jgi:hypothetical protein
MLQLRLWYTLAPHVLSAEDNDIFSMCFLHMGIYQKHVQSRVFPGNKQGVLILVVHCLPGISPNAAFAMALSLSLSVIGNLSISISMEACN